jgi:hypothetical protein
VEQVELASEKGKPPFPALDDTRVRPLDGTYIEGVVEVVGGGLQYLALPDDCPLTLKERKLNQRSEEGAQRTRTVLRDT